LYEEIDLVSSTAITGLLYGIALSLYVLSSRSLYPQLKVPDQRRHAIFMSVYTSVVMICGIMYFALTVLGDRLAYIDHNTSIGEPLDYLEIFDFTQPSGITLNIFGLLIDVLTLGIQIWRLWVIYSATRYAVVVIILPVLLFLCFIAMGVINLVPIPVTGDAYETLVVSQLTIEILVTVLVVARLLVVRRRHIRLMGASEISKQYMSIATMLIESYALESAWTLAVLVAHSVNSTAVYTFFADCDGAIEVIAYLLVIYRVSTGRGWNKQTERQLSSLHF
ncbi:hypothetical protein P691DRAFT_645849, partial [Macrolepiota fuliginosa MF-IS2]